VDGLQTPAPSQREPVAAPPLHVLAPHDVPLFAATVHVPVPLHVPSAPQTISGFVGQLSRCGFVNAAAGLHTPSPPPGCCWSAPMHTEQKPVDASQAVLQHRPSTQ
jgi:hypothetical protein